MSVCVGSPSTLWSKYYSIVLSFLLLLIRPSSRRVGLSRDGARTGCSSTGGGGGGSYNKQQMRGVEFGQTQTPHVRVRMKLHVAEAASVWSTGCSSLTEQWACLRNTLQGIRADSLANGSTGALFSFFHNTF